MVRASLIPSRWEPPQMAIPRQEWQLWSELLPPFLNGVMCYGDGPIDMEKLFREWNEQKREKSRDELAAAIGEELRAFEGNWLPWRRWQSLELKTRADRVEDDPNAIPEQDDGVVLRVAKAAVWQGLNWLCLQEGYYKGLNTDHRHYRAKFLETGDWRRWLKNIIRCHVRREERAEEWFGQAEDHGSWETGRKSYRPRKVPFVTRSSEFCDNEALRGLNDGHSMEPLARPVISEKDQEENELGHWLALCAKLGKELNSTFETVLACYLHETDMKGTKGAAIAYIAAKCDVPPWRVRTWMDDVFGPDEVEGNISVA